MGFRTPSAKEACWLGRGSEKSAPFTTAWSGQGQRRRRTFSWDGFPVQPPIRLRDEERGLQAREDGPSLSEDIEGLWPPHLEKGPAGSKPHLPFLKEEPIALPAVCRLLVALRSGLEISPSLLKERPGGEQRECVSLSGWLDPLQKALGQVHLSPDDADPGQLAKVLGPVRAETVVGHPFELLDQPD